MAWKNMERFVILDKDESLLHDYWFSFFCLRLFYLLSKQVFYKLGTQPLLNLRICCLVYLKSTALSSLSNIRQQVLWLCLKHVSTSLCERLFKNHFSSPRYTREPNSV